MPRATTSRAAAALLLLGLAAAAATAGSRSVEAAAAATATGSLGVEAAAGETRIDEAGDSATRRVRPSLVLLTLDTTRADHVGPERQTDPGRSDDPKLGPASGPVDGSGPSLTPALDALAADGIRYTRALTPSPLTLPAHASLMTGLDPPAHGVRDNGRDALAAEIPTLAGALARRGYETAAFVASRVLDRRFGLGRGFDLYDDSMTAERLGEYGYPERDAAAVTSAAIAWLDALPAERPFFIWVHYYDPHAPYAPPRASPSASAARRYAGEIAFMDGEIGRLLDALPARSAGRVVAVAGDHGEALGEHGERGHGIFLYGASLEVPLILAGRGVPGPRIAAGTVSTRRLPATLLALLDPSSEGELPGPPLPGILEAPPGSTPAPVYSETRLPATAYGWAPLQAMSDDRWRLIEAPRRELYDLAADPGETRNLAADEPAEARRLLRHLRIHEAATPRRETRARKPNAGPNAEPDAGPNARPDAELAAALRSLGYLGSAGRASAIDPKDGIGWLAEFEQARSLAARGDHRAARAALADLVARNPRNVPFLTHLAAAQLETGDAEAAIATYRRALALDPESEFLRLHLAAAYGRLGRAEEARRAYRTVLERDPRSSVAWLRLAEAARDAGRPAEELELLRGAVDAGTTSAVVHHRLGQLAAAGADWATAQRHFDRAIELIPGWPSPMLGLARVHRTRGEPAAARRLLEQILAQAPASPAAAEARALLAALPAPE